MAARLIHDAAAQAPVSRQRSELGHHDRERPLRGRIEMTSVGELLERKPLCLNTFSYPPQAQHVDLGPTGTQRACGLQLRWDVAAAVEKDEQKFHGVSFLSGQKRPCHQKHPVEDVVDR